MEKVRSVRDGNETGTGFIRVRESQQVFTLVFCVFLERKKEEEKAARAMQIEAMKMATEKLKKQNDDSRKRVEWETTTGVSSLTGRRFGQ